VGMFDYFKSSYDLGGDFTNVTCQTKDLDCCMTFYWLDPEGVLWCPDYTGTSMIDIIEEDDPGYNPDMLFLNYKMLPTGNRGKMSPYEFTGSVDIYPDQYDKVRKKLCLFFTRGVLKSYEVLP
jgi:hypothetical protein